MAYVQFGFCSISPPGPNLKEKYNNIISFYLIIPPKKSQQQQQQQTTATTKQDHHWVVSVEWEFNNSVAHTSPVLIPVITALKQHNNIEFEYKTTHIDVP